MCKFDIPLTTQKKEDNQFFIKSNRNSISYDKKQQLEISPKVTYKSDLIIRFKKAMSSEDTFTKYLSFYHIIEYFFDSIYNEEVISKMKSWFMDAEFKLEDYSILKFVDKAKKLKEKSREDGQGNEFDAFLLVLNKFIDLDKVRIKLKDFTKEKMKNMYNIEINENDMFDFYKNQSVHFIGEDLEINFVNDDKLIRSIRNRIYNIRNSLVHNKDNYNLKTYNPYDDEQYLKKEIILIKIIAIEIIINRAEAIKNL